MIAYLVVGACVIGAVIVFIRFIEIDDGRD